MRGVENQRCQLRRNGHGVAIGAGELIDESETGQRLDGLDDHWVIGADMTIRRGAAEKHAQTLKTTRIPVWMTWNIPPQHGESAQSAQYRAVGGVKATEDRDEAPEGVDRIGLGEGLRQVREAAGFSEVVVDGFKQDFTATEVVIDGHARDFGLTRDRVDAEAPAADQDAPGRGDDLGPRRVH